ncbi:MAG: lipoprotein LprG [Frankiaceae bacterium]|nr:lipoprotein LprG [Frankiaceae bacterium]
MLVGAWQGGDVDRRGSSALVALFAVATVVSCSSSKPSVTPATALAAAKTRLDATSGVHFTLAGAPVPSSGTSLEKAEGDAAPPASFTGTATIHSGSVTATVKVISVGGVVYVKQPFGSGFTTVDPAKLGLVDPGALLSPERGISTFLTADKAAKADGSVRVGGEVLERYRATLDTVGVLSTDVKDVPAEFDLVKGTHELRRVVLTGHFFDASTATTLTLTLTKYGQHVDIRAP